jgi:hypothetical protein
MDSGDSESEEGDIEYFRKSWLKKYWRAEEKRKKATLDRVKRPLSPQPRESIKRGLQQIRGAEGGGRGEEQGDFPAPAHSGQESSGLPRLPKGLPREASFNLRFAPPGGSSLTTAWKNRF